MNIWNELGIEPSRDPVEIKRAYALRLKKVNPEDDAEGFQRLRLAYERALAATAWPIATPPPPPTVTTDLAPTGVEPPGAAPLQPRPQAIPAMLQSAVSLLEQLQNAEVEAQPQVLSLALKQEGWEALDFQQQLQKTLVRLLISNFERLQPLVRVFAAQFGWDESHRLGRADPLIAELMLRNAARRWRNDIETSTDKRNRLPREALQLLRGPLDEAAFTRFAQDEYRLSAMRGLLREAQRDTPGALRFEVNPAAGEWWLKRVQQPPPPKPQRVIRQSEGNPMRYLLFILMGLGALGRFAGAPPSGTPDNSVPRPAYMSRPAYPAAPRIQPSPASSMPLLSAPPPATTIGPLRAGALQSVPGTAAAWSEFVSYPVGALVVYKGRNWEAVSPSAGQAPGSTMAWMLR